MRLFPTLAFLLAVTAVFGGEPVNLEVVSKIRAEAFHRSQAMDTARVLADEIGPRLTNSPQMKAANEWTLARLEAYGCQNGRLEQWGPFGRGWSLQSSSFRMTAPYTRVIEALPGAWTAATPGPVSGVLTPVVLETEADLERWRGKLKGKMVLLKRTYGPIPRIPIYERFGPRALAELKAMPEGQHYDDGYFLFRQYLENLDRVARFLAEEEVLLAVRRSYFYGGIRLSRAGFFGADQPVAPPTLTIGVEEFNLLERLVDSGTEVRVACEIQSRFHDDDPYAYNTIAEIPGSDLADQIVMVGGHLDSWVAGDGAADNAAGCAVVMEVARIFQALGLQPRRTIRFALWSGEEQGLLGSIAHLQHHFVDFEGGLAPFIKETAFINPPYPPFKTRPAYASLSAYFNLDNGAGRLRGIYAERNTAVAPIFQAWLKPFHDVGADTVTVDATPGSDHEPFNRVGLPGFQFIQDPVSYTGLQHHSSLDTMALIEPEDLVQAAAVLTSFVYHAAMRDQPLPRTDFIPKR